MNTKWNALGFKPGLVGGHCIGVDPYYFTYEAEKLGYHSQIILNGRIVNDGMAAFVAAKTVERMVVAGLAPRKSKLVILGLTFKEIDEKGGLLKLTTDRRMQQLMEKQRNLQEEEARRHQDEIERIKAKEADDDKRRIKSQEEAERRQHILNWIVAILTIAQVMQAAYELLKPEKDKDFISIWISVGIGVVFAVMLILLMWKDIVNFFKIIFRKQYNN